MRYIMTFVWSFLLVALLNYVCSSIANVPFDFEAGIMISIIIAILIIILGESIPEEAVSDN